MDEHSAWKNMDGDHTFALNWDIGASARVWEIGGFEGRWAAQIVEHYDPYMEIFEPQTFFFEKLGERFASNPKVEIHGYGLWVTNAALPIYKIGTDGASLIDTGAHSEVRQFMDVYDCMRDVDLALMNIEGAEYALLPYMIGCDLFQHFRYFWCQFHPRLVSEAETRFLRIYEGMKRTHRVLWNFYPSAVAWERY